MVEVDALMFQSDTKVSCEAAPTPVKERVFFFGDVALRKKKVGSMLESDDQLCTSLFFSCKLLPVPDHISDVAVP